MCTMKNLVKDKLNYFISRLENETASVSYNQYGKLFDYIKLKIKYTEAERNRLCIVTT